MDVFWFMQDENCQCVINEINREDEKYYYFICYVLSIMLIEIGFMFLFF